MDANQIYSILSFYDSFLYKFQFSMVNGAPNYQLLEKVRINIGYIPIRFVSAPDSSSYYIAINDNRKYLVKCSCTVSPLTANCFTCLSDGITCLNCLQGYKVSSSGKCDLCADTYFKNSTNLCTSCGSNCKTCDSAILCTICSTGYLL